MGLSALDPGDKSRFASVSSLLHDLAHAGASPPGGPMATVISDALKSGSPIVDISR